MPLAHPGPNHRKSHWFTESGGWEISNLNGGTYEKTSSLPIDPLLQAAYRCRYYVGALRLAVDRVAPFFVEDVDKHNAGFFKRDENGGVIWRPSAFAIQNMIKLLPQPKLVEVTNDGPDLHLYKIQPNVLTPSEPILMAWNVTGPTNISFPFPVKVTDMLGNAETTAANTAIAIGPCPVYILTK